MILYMHGILKSSVGVLNVDWMGMENFPIMAAVGKDGKWSVVKPVLQNMDKQGGYWEKNWDVLSHLYMAI